VSEAAADELRRRLREAGEEELARLVTAAGDSLGVPEARQILRNPFVRAEVLESLAAIPALVSRYEVRRELVAHPRTPRTLALQLVAGLYWRELAALGIDTRVHPIVRRAADRRLLERLPGLAIGEKSALARGASAAVIAGLRLDPNPRVVAALLENPRLTEVQLMPLAGHERAASRCLAAVAANARWAARPAIRAALCRNPATPLGSSLQLLPGLGRDQLAAVAADPRLAAPLRDRARELLAAGGRGRR
jgi:hypothetical protein